MNQNTKTNHITKQIKSLPLASGCYLFRDDKKNVLYIGKAKKLRHRVNSYFTKSQELSPAKQEMVKLIKDIDYIAVRTEEEALLLESNLIKQFQPKFNINLKDDKFFQYIKIINEKYPRIVSTRRIIKDGSEYFGPYSSGTAIKNTLKFLKKIAPFRTSRKNDFYFDILNRHKKISEQEYAQNIKIIKNILNGNTQQVVKNLETKMQTASSAKNYELAAVYRDRLSDFKKITSNQQAILNRTDNIDVLTFIDFDKTLYISLLKIHNGKIIDKLNTKIKNPLKNPAEALRLFIIDMYQNIENQPSIILSPIDIDFTEQELQQIFHKKIIIKVPKRGTLKKLLQLSQINANEFARTSQPTFTAATNIAGALQELKKELKLKKLPKRIECYDISNIQGSYAVGSMVVFTNGMADKSQYRKFSIKYTPTTKPNDFAMMSEVLARRLRHTEWPDADLIIIDGGKGQLSSANKTLENNNIKIPITALAKKNEELFLPNKSQPIILKYQSPAYFIVQRIRDEAHRFAINYYRLKHKKALIKGKI